MGCWGMGITQSDEFCEIYDRFMDSYNEGKEVSEITAAILAEYHAEFDDDDGVMHDVYFALAKAEWMCCAQSELILNRVKEIIESGANIKFYRELEATEKDLKVRGKNLEKFLTSLLTPREKPRRRRIDPLDRVKDLPPLEVGECYRYKYENGYRVFAVLGFNRAQGWQDMARCAIFKKTYSASELKTVDLLREPIHSIACYIGSEFIAPSAIKKIAEISVPDGLYMTSLSAFQVTLGNKKDFKSPFDKSLETTLSELFASKASVKSNAPKLSNITKGDVFAYNLGAGYRVFCLISHAQIGDVYAAYCYVWARFFDEIPSVESLADDYVLPLGYFTSATFPTAEKLILIGNYPEAVSSVGGLIYPHFINEAWKPATTALAKEDNLSEEIPFSLCMKMSDAIRKLNELRAAAVQKEEQNSKKGDTEMFGFKKKETKNTQSFDKVLESLVRNEISITARKSQNTSPVRSKFGGRPAVPADFEWPRFEGENFDGEVANRPLSFLCQIDLAEVKAYDKDNLLPERGLLLFFYEQNTMCWGFDPADAGCARVYHFEDTSALAPAEFPDDLDDEYKVREYDLSFEAKASYPSFEELECHSDADPDWDDYEEAAEKLGYDIECERHKLLGYANTVQGEMLTECERTTRGLYCGNPESYEKTSDDEKADINRTATDWILLFQLASIQDDDYELMFGDLGDLYFYIRKQDLAERNFEKIWLVLQCG